VSPSRAPVQLSTVIIMMARWVSSGVVDQVRCSSVDDGMFVSSETRRTGHCMGQVQNPIAYFAEQ